MLMLLMGAGQAEPPAADPDRWTWVNTGLEAAFVAATFVDVLTTNALLHDGITEMNPLLGPRPSKARLYATMLTANVLHCGAAYFLPARWREAWQGLGLGVELGIILHNESFYGSLKLTF